MDRNKEISSHEIAVFKALRIDDGWLTSRDIARIAKVAPRTARAHALKLVQLGIAEQAEVFPANRYRITGLDGNRGYMERLERAADALGITLEDTTS